MDSKASSILFFALLCLFASTPTAFNITRILSNYPDFGAFNELLTQTGLAQQINSRQTITILAVANSSLDDVSGKDVNLVKRILSAHVILDYYDGIKLSKMQKKSNILTTLYQTTGIADDSQGFVNVTRTPEGFLFGSAMKDAPLSSKLMGAVTTQPYNISVLQVSEIIQIPGIDGMAPPPPPPHAAAPPTNATAPPPEEDDEAEPSTPPAQTPTAAPTPAASPPVADGPEADGPTADEKPASVPEKSGSSRMEVGIVALVMGLSACVLGF